MLYERAYLDSHLKPSIDEKSGEKKVPLLKLRRGHFLSQMTGLIRIEFFEKLHI